MRLLQSDMTKNIFYASNSYSAKFSNNTRSSFKCQIDPNEFSYFKHNNISAAIKSITFQNSFNTYEAKNDSPNLILIQNFVNEEPLLRYEGKYTAPHDIDIKSGLDYYIFASGDKLYAEGKNFVYRNFTDVKIFCDEMDLTMKDSRLSERKHKYSFVIHTIYFHQATYQTSSELIEYLNYVFRNIEYDLSENLQLTNQYLFEEMFGCTVVHSKTLLNLDIYLSGELAQILGFIERDLENVYASSLRELAEFNMEKKSRPDVIYYKPIESFIDIFTIEEPLRCKTHNPQANLILDREFLANQNYFSVLGGAHGKEISVRSSWKINLSSIFPTIIGLRTNLKKPDIFKEGSFDSQVEFINVGDCTNGVIHFTAKSPSYFSTTIERVCNAKFEILDIDTNKHPNFALGSPTYIQLLVSNEPNMSKQFNVFLDSSDTNSKKFYPNNTYNDFSTKLPERLEFNKNWTVALKNIFIGNDLLNIYRDSCWIRFSILRGTGSGTNWPTHTKIKFYTPAHPQTGEAVLEDLVSFRAYIALEDIKLRSIDELCEYIQTSFDHYNIQLKIRVEINRIFISFDKTGDYVLKEFVLKLSPHLANILGFSKGGQKVSKLRLDVKNEYMATYQPSISLLVPTNFLVLCDIVTESVFGNKSIRILRLLSTNFDSEKDIIHFSFYQDEPVDLHVKEFSTIRIQILDATGNLIKASGSYPTRCQLLFSQKSM